MSITINNSHWLVADWIMRTLFKEILYEVENSYENHQSLKDKIDSSIELHTYSLNFNTETEIQSIADLGFLLNKSEKRRIQNKSIELNITKTDSLYLKKINDLKILIESYFKSSISNEIFDSQRLEDEYRSLIWLYLEKISYYLIYLNKELKPNLNKIELTELENYKSNFSIHYSNSKDELENSKLFQNLLNLIPRNDKLISAIIYLGKDQKSGIVNYRNHSVKSDLTELSKFHRVFKIRQEWGGSYWKVRYAKIKTQDEFGMMTYKEINKLKMEFTFKLN